MTQKTKSKSKTSKKKKASKSTTVDTVKTIADDLPEEFLHFDEMEDGGKRLVAVMQQMSKRHSGPLPPAEEFHLYEGTHKGSAKRILNYADKEQAHRHAMDGKAMLSTNLETILGQIFGFLIMISLITAALFSAFHDHEVLAGAFFVSASLGVVRKFIQGRTKAPED